MKKHKHCELIKKWADGATIQFLSIDEWCSCTLPFWHLETEYRVEPQPAKFKIGQVVLLSTNRVDKIAKVVFMGDSWQYRSFEFKKTHPILNSALNIWSEDAVVGIVHPV